MLSILVLEDLAMAVYLPILAALLVGGGALATMGSIVIAVGAAGAALVLALRFGEHVSRLVAHRSDEVVLLVVLGLVLVVAGAAQELQVSAAVGAFLVGVALSGEVAEDARRLLTPLRDLFAAIFFVFFGLGIDIGSLPAVAAVAVALAVVTAITKIVTGWWAARRAGVAARGRARAGAALVARGEFSIVIAGLGVAAGVEADLGPLAAAYVLVLAFAGPILMRYSTVLAARGRAPHPRPDRGDAPARRARLRRARRAGAYDRGRAVPPRRAVRPADVGGQPDPDRRDRGRRDRGPRRDPLAGPAPDGPQPRRRRTARAPAPDGRLGPRHGPALSGADNGGGRDRLDPGRRRRARGARRRRAAGDRDRLRLAAPARGRDRRASSSCSRTSTASAT